MFNSLFKKPNASITAVSFSAHKNGTDQTGVLNNTSTKVTFPTEDWDINSNYDAANSKFVPTIAGKYLIVGNISFVTLTAGKSFASILKKNGATVSSNIVSSGNDWPSASLSVMVNMNGTTDYLELFAYQESGGTLSITGGAIYTYFQATLIK